MSKKYSELTVPEQWEWHARVYAFRRVVLGVSPDVRNSPPDPNGEWFDASAVDDAERRLRDKYAARQREIDKDRQEADQRYERARLARDQMARELGYPDFGVMLSMGLVNAVNSRQSRQQSAPKAAPLTETDREELRRARIALGIDTPNTLAAE